MQGETVWAWTVALHVASLSVCLKACLYKHHVDGERDSEDEESTRAGYFAQWQRQGCSQKRKKEVYKKKKNKDMSQMSGKWSEAEREKCFQGALMVFEQPYGYAGARMQWCVWHVLGTQRSGVAEAAAARGRPPLVGCCRPPFLSSVHKASIVSVCIWFDSNCSLFTWINCACICLSLTHHPSGGVICPTPPGDRE